MKQYLLVRIALFVFTLATFTSCKTKEIAPATGNLIINAPEAVSYVLYTELAYFNNGPYMQLEKITSKQFEIKGLNAGNYIIDISRTTWSARYSVQVVAGTTKELNL